MQKLGWFGGQPRSLETSPFDRAYMASYSTLIETMHLSCTVFELKLVFRLKWPILTYPTCIFCPHKGWSFEFHCKLWCQKTRDPGLSCDIIYVILYFSRFGTIPECDRHTHRHTTMAYATLSIASRGKNWQ